MRMGCDLPRGEGRAGLGWLQWRWSWSTCPLVESEERPLPHKMPMWKICNACPSFPKGDAPGRNPGLLLQICLCRSPLLIQPHLDEITGLLLMHYQKIPTCDETGLTVTFYKASWEKCFMIKWSEFLPELHALLFMFHFGGAGCVFLTFFLTITF